METVNDVVEFEGDKKALDQSVKAMVILIGLWLMCLVYCAIFMRLVQASFDDRHLTTSATRAPQR